jgi:predicted DNA repair protein MutK
MPTMARTMWPARPRPPEELENERVSSAIRTDFILSAEIMAIALSTVATLSIWMQGATLVVVGVLMTVLVYGAVALIVKADDVGASLARRADGVSRAVGRALVLGMPGFLKGLSFVGMVAMLWVGGGIVVHGLHELGVHAPEEIIQRVAGALTPNVAVLGPVVHWAVGAALSAVEGLAIGAAVDPLARHVLVPLWKRLRPAPRAAA